MTGAGSGAVAAAAGASRTMVSDSTPAGATISGSATASALAGASTSAEYSRTSRPWPQSASTRKLNEGVSTGVCEVTRTTALPCALRVSSNCSSLTRPAGRCRPTRSKVTGEASATRRFSSSDGSAEITGISASNGCPGLDRTRMSPRPRAMAELLTRASSAAERQVSGRRAPLARLFMGDTIKRADQGPHPPGRRTAVVPATARQARACIDKALPASGRHYRSGNSGDQRFSAATSSASCTALRAAPLRTLSDTIHRFRPRGCDRSSRMRPTYTASVPEAWVTGVG